jgi:hypothetical protein
MWSLQWGSDQTDVWREAWLPHVECSFRVSPRASASDHCRPAAARVLSLFWGPPSSLQEQVKRPVLYYRPASHRRGAGAEILPRELRTRGQLVRPTPRYIHRADGRRPCQRCDRFDLTIAQMVALLCHDVGDDLHGARVVRARPRIDLRLWSPCICGTANRRFR